MTRGNQRELAREKGMKKMQESSKGQRHDNLSHQQRKEADAERMRQKQAEAEARKRADDEAAKKGAQGKENEL